MLRIACALLTLAVGIATAGDTLIVLNKSDATASLLDPVSGQELALIDVGVGPHEVAVSPDGATAVVCNYGQQTPGGSLTVIDLNERRAVKTIELVGYHRPHGIQYIDDRRVLVTAEAEKKLLVVDVPTGAIESAFITGEELSHMVAFDARTNRAFVANIVSGSCSVIDLQTGELVRIIDTGAGAEGVAVHPAKNEVWVTNRQGNTITIIDTESLETLSDIRCGTFPIRVTFTPDGSMALVSCAMSGQVEVYSGRDYSKIKTIDMALEASDDQEGRLFNTAQGPVPVGILVNPAGTTAYVANTNADIVTVIDLKTLEITGRMRAGKEPDGMAWSSIEDD